MGCWQEGGNWVPIALSGWCRKSSTMGEGQVDIVERVEIQLSRPEIQKNGLPIEKNGHFFCIVLK